MSFSDFIVIPSKVLLLLMMMMMMMMMMMKMKMMMMVMMMMMMLLLRWTPPSSPHHLPSRQLCIFEDFLCVVKLSFHRPPKKAGKRLRSQLGHASLALK
jgi:hypothetical protein